MKFYEFVVEIVGPLPLQLEWIYSIGTICFLFVIFLCFLSPWIFLWKWFK